MEILNAQETAARLPYPALADSIREAAIARASDEMQAPPRTILPLPEGGFLLVMPASDAEISITKLVTVHPENAARGLPSIQGEMVVMEAATGRRLGILDGATVTGRRTAALSLLAARELAPHPGGPLLILGAGTQARSHLEAFREGLDVSKVLIVSRTREHAEALARHAGDIGMEAEVVDRPEEAMGEARLVVTATTSREPVLAGGDVDGKFVAAVGSFQPEAAEISAEMVGRSEVVVDTLEGAREEAGDLIRAEAAGAFGWERAMDLASALSDPPSTRGPILFKSVGDAAWDLAAARTAFGLRKG